MCATMCDICSRHDISDGVIQLNVTCCSRRKFIYFDVTNNTYVYAYRTKALQHGWRYVPSCCSCCRNYIITHGKHAPVHKTSVPFYNGWTGTEYYFHGIRQPPELQGLSLAEKALISMVQVVFQLKTLKYGRFNPW